MAQRMRRIDTGQQFPGGVRRRQGTCTQCGYAGEVVRIGLVMLGTQRVPAYEVQRALGSALLSVDDAMVAKKQEQS